MSTYPFACGFAWPGTYGHECGKPAEFAGLQKAETPVLGGVFHAYRCAKCREIKGGENAPVYAFEPLDKARHVNRWL